MALEASKASYKRYKNSNVLNYWLSLCSKCPPFTFTHAQRRKHWSLLNCHICNVLITTTNLLVLVIC